MDELNLLNDLSDASEIATRTKLNINKTPAVVSVLHADKLKKLGVINLYEALETVPGIEVSIGTAGAKQINMRGNKSLVRDKIKMMINGVSVNSELSGSSFYYLDLPIELIERIEVIRGPSSALYGSFAHIGVINVITKSSIDRDGLLFANISSEGFGNTGFIQQFKLEKLRVGIDASFQKNKNSREYGSYSLISSQDKFTSYEDYTNKLLGINIQYDNDIFFQTRWLELDTQNFFGYGDWPISGDPKRLKTTSFTGELRYTPKISKELSMDIKLGYKEYKFGGEARYIPYSILPSPPYPQYDLIGEGHYKEKVLYSDIALDYTLEKHKILLGTYFSKSKKKESTHNVNNPLVSEVINQPQANIKNDISRFQHAIYLHDIYSITNQWTLNVGGRYDYYNDVDSSIAPKVALLYNNLNDSYKLMYQRSFRAPSWLELYGLSNPYVGDESLKSEIIDTIEFAYTNQTAFDNRFTLNLFYSDMKNFINRNSNFEFFNDDCLHSYGAELEWLYPLDDTTELHSNYSYVYIEDSDKNQLPFVANHLANIMLYKQWNRKFHSGSTLRYVSSHSREDLDTRADLDGYARFDQAVTYTHKSLTLQMTVKNVFDQEILVPSQVGNPPTSGTYINDFPRDGRSFWISAEWKL